MMVMNTKKYEKTLRRLEREWKAAVRREEEATNLAWAWRLAGRSDNALRRLQAARAGIELPKKETKRSKALAGFAALAAIGRVVARSLKAAASLAKARAVLAAKKLAKLAARSLRSVVAVVATLALTSNPKETAMKTKTCSTCSAEMPIDCRAAVCGGCELRAACSEARWAAMQYATPKPSCQLCGEIDCEEHLEARRDHGVES